MGPAPITDPRSPLLTAGVPRLPNLKALTSIRFFAALHVALYHFVTPHTRWGRLSPVISVGYLGVSFFFILSGFILTYSHAQEYESGRGSAVRFLVARAARIYPVYLISTALAAYVMRDQLHPHVHLVALAADLFLVQSWSSHLVNFFNVPAWSLSSEAFFYLVLPFLLMPLRPTTRGRALLMMVTLWLVALAVPLICLKVYPFASWHDVFNSAIPGGDLVFKVRRLPLLALPQFLAGISLGWFHLRFSLSQRTASLFASVGLLLLALVLVFSDHLPFLLLHNGLLLPLFAMLILGLSKPNWLSRPLAHPALLLLGEASFAFYLVHYLFNVWLRDQFAVPETIPAALWKLAVVIPLSILLHLFVERPGRRLILQWWRRRHPMELTMPAG